MATVLNHPVTVAVPATVGNVGPGFDVMGLAISGLADRVSLTVAKNGHDELVAVAGIDADLVPREPSNNALFKAAHRFLQIVGTDGPLRVKVHRSIPIAGGLGSSAAACVAGALAAAHAVGKSANTSAILQAAAEIEGEGSGCHLDNVAPCLLGGVCAACGPTIEDIRVLVSACPWWFGVVTPDCLLPTSESRQALPTTLASKQWISQMQRTLGVATAFQQSDIKLLANCCHDAYAEPHRGKMIPGYFAAKAAGLAAGAAAVVISGGGPTILAICQDQQTSQKTVAAMAKALPTPPRLTHIAQLAPKGAYVE